MATPIELALANDFEIVILGLARLLAPYRERVRVADYVVRDQHLAHRADVVLFDVFAHEDLGFGELKALVEDPNIDHLAIFTWQLDNQTLERGFAAGVAGFLAKNLTADELVDGLERIAGGERVVAGHAPSDHTSTERDWPLRHEGLTERESEVLILIADGHTNLQIAAALHVSPNSVKTHVRSAYRKLGVERRAQAVKRVLELGTGRIPVDPVHWQALTQTSPESRFPPRPGT
jgi:DNA-binding NarL/FixJ family response regulator